MVVNEVGALAVGAVLGYLLGHTAYGKNRKWDAKAFAVVAAAIVGSGGTLAFAVDYVGYLWIGIFLGFVANLLIRYLKEGVIPTYR
ncbi:MAG: hypothetical protein JRM99_06325 [Nitrososphaerota archaeon]|nr:hypothetical protein [Nitrososphaerota archaeon]